MGDDAFYKIIEDCLNQEPGLVAHYAYIQDDTGGETPVLFVLAPSGHLYTVVARDTVLDLHDYERPDGESVSFDLNDPDCWRQINKLLAADQ